MIRPLRTPGIGRCMLALLAGLGLGGAAFAEPVGTGFTYQGKLTDNGVAFTGTVDLRFELWSSDVGGGGIQIGGADTVLGRPVVDGVFTAMVNDNDEFGANAFKGDARWLRIQVRDADIGGAYTPLASRQPITPGPYALFAADGAGSGLWQLNGSNIYYDSGSVGIGTTEPGGALDVVGSIRAIRGVDPDQFIQISSASSSGHWLIARTRESNKKTLTIQSTHDGSGSPSGASQIRFRVGAHSAPTEAMRIREDGRVGIGTTSPDYGRLEVQQSSDARDQGIAVTNTTNNSLRLWVDDTNVRRIEAGQSGTERLTLNSGSGNVGIGPVPPEQALHISRLGGAALLLDADTNNNDVSHPKVLFRQDSEPNGSRMGIRQGTDAFEIINERPADLILATNGADRVTIKNNGHVGIGITAPAVPLHVAGGDDVSLSGGGDLVLGSLSGRNISIDGNEIMARNDEGTASLHLNLEGGDVTFFLNEDPSQSELHVAGDLRIDGDIHISETTRYYTVDPSALSPGSANMPYSLGPTSFLVSNQAAPPGTNHFFIVAPITLPSGAVITELRWQVYDTVPSEDIRICLQRFAIDGSGSLPCMAVANTVGNTGSVMLTTTDISDATVNNRDYAYHLWAKFDHAVNGSMGLGAIRITYTIESPLP